MRILQRNTVRSSADRAFSVLVTTLLLTISASCSVKIPPDVEQLSRDVYVEELEPGLWRHVSHRFYPGAGYLPSNGLVVALPDDGALLVDTAWTNEQTAIVLDWIGEVVGEPRAVVISHAHDDRMGGIEEVHRRGIASYGLESTSQRGVAQGWPPLSNTFSGRLSLDTLGARGEIFFPGAAHTPDNVVVWLEDHQTLFGGCMVRASTSGIGNLGDAVVGAYANSAETLVERYRSAARVVPGHGDPGDASLLRHTAKLASGID